MRGSGGGRAAGLAAVAVLLSSGCASVAEVEPEGREAPAAADAPDHVADDGWLPTQTWIDTLDVADLALEPGALWAASRGGVERFDAPAFAPSRHYTRADGLDASAALAVRIRGGEVEVLPRTARCTLARATDRFRCTPRRPGAPEPSQTSRGELAGHRMTARVGEGARAFAATAGAGVWDVSAEPRPLGRSALPCGAHVNAVAEHAGAVWVGTFHGGVCRAAGGGAFVHVDGPQMVNDLASTPDGLYAAASEGLFVWREDEERFVRLRELPAEPVNRLSFADGVLWATSIEHLHRLQPDGRPRVTSWQWPAGSRSLQAVAARDGVVWLASEDRGAIRFDGRAFRAFDATTGLPTSWAMDVAHGPDGAAYVATLRDGVYRIAPDGRVARLPGTPDPWTLRLAMGPEGLWIGTQGGAVLHDGVSRAEPLAGLPDGRVHAFHARDGRVLVGTEAGLAAYALPSR